jgi:hypothetical protein
MQGEVADMTGAARWIAEQLLWHFPDAEAELFLDPRGPFHPMKHRGPLKDVLPFFTDFCSKMPRAWVNYQPDHPYGIVSKIVGHCNCPNGQCKHFCARYDERPHAMLTITRIGKNDILLGGYREEGKGGGI